jgi:hypothetical protein
LQGLQAVIGIGVLAESPADMRGYTPGYAGIRALAASSAQVGRDAVRMVWFAPKKEGVAGRLTPDAA